MCRGPGLAINSIWKGKRVEEEHTSKSNNMQRLPGPHAQLEFEQFGRDTEPFDFAHSLATHSDSAIPQLPRTSLHPSFTNAYIPDSMSLSPISSGQDNSSKRRRTDDEFGYSRGPMDMSPQDSPSNGHPSMNQAIPKRGQRACTACRKGKNRCEGEVRLL